MSVSSTHTRERGASPISVQPGGVIGTGATGGKHASRTPWASAREAACSPNSGGSGKRCSCSMAIATRSGAERGVGLTASSVAKEAVAGAVPSATPATMAASRETIGIPLES